MVIKKSNAWFLIYNHGYQKSQYPLIIYNHGSQKN